MQWTPPSIIQTYHRVLLLIPSQWSGRENNIITDRLTLINKNALLYIHAKYRFILCTGFNSVLKYTQLKGNVLTWRHSGIYTYAISFFYIYLRVHQINNNHLRYQTAIFVIIHKNSHLYFNHLKWFTFSTSFLRILFTTFTTIS